MTTVTHSARQITHLNENFHTSFGYGYSIGLVSVILVFLTTQGGTMATRKFALVTLLLCCTRRCCTRKVLNFVHSVLLELRFRHSSSEIFVLGSIQKMECVNII